MILVAYVVGMFPTAQLVGRHEGLDPTAAGSGNPGATNVYRLAGWRAGAVVLAIDAAKGAIPTAVALAVLGRGWALGAAVAAVLGHIAPVVRRFHGGKGVATAAGASAVLWPAAAVALTVVFVVVARLGRTASVASLAIAAGLPVAVAVSGRPGREVAVAVLLAVLVVARHHANIRRLLHGEERAVGDPRPGPERRSPPDPRIPSP